MKIHNLTVRQRNMLDLMWNIPTIDSLKVFASKLPPDDQTMIWTLYQLCILSAQEELVTTADTSWILEEIKKIQKKYN